MRNDVNKDLQAATVLMWGLSNLGYNLTKIMFQLRDELDLMPAISREFRHVYRDVTALRSDPEEALATEIRDHPSKEFARIMRGESSVSRVVGSLADYLEESTRQVIKRLRDEWEEYYSAVNNMGELELLFLLILPLFAVLFSLTTDNPVYGSDSVDLLLLPLVGVGLYVYVVSVSSWERVSVKGNLLMGVTGVALGITFNLIASLYLSYYHPYWLYLSVPLMMGGFGYGYTVHRQLSRKNDAETRLFGFMSSVRESLRVTGYGLSKSLDKVRSKELGREINRMISSFLALSSMVKDRREAIPHTDSWITASVFKTMVALDDSDILTPVVARKLTEFTEEYYDAIRVRRRRMYAFAIVSFLSPLILTAMIAVTFYAFYDVSVFAGIPLYHSETMGCPSREVREGHCPLPSPLET